ncbi:DUF1566 domain-containing protein [Vibrio cholerae]|nr:DUF1566 domain-containing protein [Vibrio cholerae]EJL6688769.1 DUF1566 domain-containing protein [Vibrio cholerae]EJX1707490.1 DUF1566 domain-containing protein [Vibrio cholerae]
MLIINYYGSLAIALSALLLAANAQASRLCAGIENTAITATTPSADFTDNGDGTVTHHKTGLIWQRCSLGQSWDGTDCIGNATEFTWADALAAGAQNSLAGFSDWRLPNKNELASIVEFRCIAPAINNQIFPATPLDWYWSSSPNATLSYSAAWIVSLGYGDVNYTSKDYQHRVRLVRAGQ